MITVTNTISISIAIAITIAIITISPGRNVHTYARNRRETRQQILLRKLS
jgi:hypothetical protein